MYLYLFLKLDFIYNSFFYHMSLFSELDNMSNIPKTYGKKPDQYELEEGSGEFYMVGSEVGTYLQYGSKLGLILFLFYFRACVLQPRP